MVALAGFFLALIFIVAAWRHARRQGGAGWLGVTLVVAGALVAPVLVTALILSAQSRMGDVRLALEQVSLEPEALARNDFTIGGDGATDSVVVPGMHAGALAISSDGRGGAQLVFNRPDHAATAGVVSLDGGETFLGTVRLDDGALIRAENRSVRVNGNRLTSGGREGRPLEGRAGAGVALYPLAYHDGSTRWSTPRWDFFYRVKDGWLPWSRRLAFVALSDNVSPAEGNRSVLLPKGERLSISFRSLQFIEPWRLDRGKSPRASRAAERRSLVAFWEGERLVLRFDTPERTTLDADAMANVLASVEAKDGIEVIFGPDPGAAEPYQGVISFNSLGEPVRAQLTRRLFLHPGSTTFAVSGGADETLRFGEAFETGGDVRVQIRASRLDLAWKPYLGIIGVVWAAALAGLAAGLRWRRDSIAAFVAMTLLEVLLAMRLLFAVEGAFVDWRPETVATVAQALLAIALAPFILTAAFAPLEGIGRRLYAAYAAVTVLLGVTVVFCVGEIDTVALVLGAGVLFALWARPLLGRDLAGLRAGAQAWLARSWFKTWLDAGGRAFERFHLWSGRALGLQAGPGGQAQVNLIILMVAGLVVLRIVLAGFDIQERLPFGGAVSLLWTPAFLLVAALGLNLLAVAPAGGSRAELLRGVGVWAAIVVLAAAPALIAGDRGYAIHLLPVAFVALLTGAALWPDLGWVRRAMLAGPGLLAVLALIGIALWASTRAPDSSEWDRIADTRSPAAHELLKRYAADEDWSLRMGQSLRRDIDAPSGSREAEEMAAAFYHMRAYGSTMWGRGLLAMDTPTELLRFHLDDNASVVHLISPHGRMGALGFLAMLWAAAAACTALVAMSGQRFGAGPLVGLLALWTIPVIAAYMTLANLQVTPFTGRNLYLLAPASISDLVEGLTLVALVLATLGPRRAA